MTKTLKVAAGNKGSRDHLTSSEPRQVASHAATTQAEILSALRPAARHLCTALSSPALYGCITMIKIKYCVLSNCHYYIISHADLLWDHSHSTWTVLLSYLRFSPPMRSHPTPSQVRQASGGILSPNSAWHGAAQRNLRETIFIQSKIII